jgi:hypothetical protein
MGAWGGFCVFDYASYTQQVVPAFRSGEQHPLIQQTLALWQQDHPRRSTFQGLAQLASYCDALMTTCSLGHQFLVCDGVLMPHSHGEARCADRWGYEDVADLFERVLTRHTISHYTVLGLSFTAVRQLFPSELDLDDTTRTLLDLLDNRCSYWALGTGGYGEGIQGWLDPEEAELLAIGLAAFPSARGTPSSSETTRILPLFEYCFESAPEYARHLAHITQFMAALEQAIALGRGVLWGRDLHLFYQHRSLFDAEEPTPIKL